MFSDSKFRENKTVMYISEYRIKNVQREKENPRDGTKFLMEFVDRGKLVFESSSFNRVFGSNNNVSKF